MGVDDLRRSDRDDPPTAIDEPTTKIVVFPVREERLVEESNGLQCLGTEHDSAGRDEVDFIDLPMDVGKQIVLVQALLMD